MLPSIQLIVRFIIQPAINQNSVYDFTLASFEPIMLTKRCEDDNYLPHIAKICNGV